MPIFVFLKLCICLTSEGDWRLSIQGQSYRCSMTMWLTSNKTLHTKAGMNFSRWQYYIHVVAQHSWENWVLSMKLHCEKTAGSPVPGLLYAPFSFTDFDLHPFAVINITMSTAAFLGPVSLSSEFVIPEDRLGDPGQMSLFFLLPFIFLQSTDIFPLSNCPPSPPPPLHSLIEPDSNLSWWSIFLFPRQPLLKW